MIHGHYTQAVLEWKVKCYPSGGILSGIEEKGERMVESNKLSQAGILGPDQQQDREPGGDLGATGIFGAGSQHGKAGSKQAEGGAPDSVYPSPIEPVVHSVDVNGSASDESQDLLARLRKASSGWEQQKAEPIPGSGGFTELIRTLPLDPKQTLQDQSKLTAEPTPPGQEGPAPAGGFTMLLRALNDPISCAASHAKPAASEEPEEPPASPKWPSSAQAQSTAAAPSGGFTELFKAMPPQNAAPGLSASPPRPWEMPNRVQPPATQGSEPMSLTQMFQLAGKEKSQPPSQAPPPASTGADEVSFTRLLARAPQQQPMLAERLEDRRPAERLNYGAVPEAMDEILSRSGAADSFAPPAPAPATSPAEGIGITRLIRMLDESPAPAQTPSPQSSVGGPLAAPAWGGPVVPPAQPAQPAPSASVSGPSEFTRILSASKMREMEMNRSPAAAAAQPPPVAAPPTAPPPALGSAAGMAGGMGAGSYAPSVQVQAGPASFSAGSGGAQGYIGMPPMQSAPASMHPPMMPAMPAPAVPQPPPAPKAPAAAGMGKMQQYIPLLLVMIIFLLVAVLVTVIFLVKR